MLDPTARTLFTDAFRAPPGHTVDLAIGTTYTLSLDLLLLPPLAMAAHDREAGLDEDDAAPADTVALLESVRRFADHTTLYCHAGAIGAPGKYRQLLTFAEDMVVQVLPRSPGHTFHPKVWALRFRQDDAITHRLVVSSRNLTHDRSWDTILILDELVNEDSTRPAIDGRPAAEFLRRLPSLAVGPIAPGRAEQAIDLAGTLGRARFEVPEPFTGGTLWPLGVGPSTSWPMPDHPDRALVISPFLDAATTSRVHARHGVVFVSRPDTFTLIGARAFEGADVRVLSAHAETELRERSTSQDAKAQGARPSEVRTGLHAKVLAWDEGGIGHLFTGSANATGAAFHGNVEFGVHLTGPRRTCGVESLLPSGRPSRERIAFGQILQPFTIADPDPQPDPAFALERAIDRFHAELAQAGPTLTVEATDEDSYAARLTFARPVPDSPGRTRVRLLSLPKTERQPVGEVAWQTVRLVQITPYLEVETTAAVPGRATPLTIAGVLKADLIGAPEDRAATVLRSYLASEADVVRYLRFLLDLGQPESEWTDLETHSLLGEGRMLGGNAYTFEDLAILEPLLRAAYAGSDALARVQSLLRDLGVDRDGSGVVPAEFLDLWESVWTATTERAK